jgi:hypothetical protein
MDDIVVAMLNALGQGPTGSTDSLTQSMQQYSPALYKAALTLHSTAVKPITSIVLSIVFSMMLATNASKVEGDRELGVRVIAGSMFKAALVLAACQAAPLLLKGIADIATFIASTAQHVQVGGAVSNSNIGDQMRSQVDDAGTMKQLGMLVILVIPFVVVKAGSVVALVLIFIRFLQMYLLSAFASLPVAFMAHDDTKSIGIGFLKRFAAAALTGTVIIIAVKFYQALVGGWLSGHIQKSDDILKFVVTNFGNFLVAPMVLIFLLVSANGLAKGLLGEG